MLMLDLPLSPAAQQWICVVLVWIGFGTLAGLLATVIFPWRRPAGPFWAVVLGIVGTTVGLLALDWLFPSRERSPISLPGFLAGTLGALVLLTLYRIGGTIFGKSEDEAEEDEEE